MPHYNRTDREFNAIRKLLPPQSKGNDVALFRGLDRSGGCSGCGSSADVVDHGSMETSNMVPSRFSMAVNS